MQFFNRCEKFYKAKIEKLQSDRRLVWAERKFERQRSEAAFGWRKKLSLTNWLGIFSKSVCRDEKVDFVIMKVADEKKESKKIQDEGGRKKVRRVKSEKIHFPICDCVCECVVVWAEVSMIPLMLRGKIGEKKKLPQCTCTLLYVRNRENI